LVYFKPVFYGTVHLDVSLHGMTCFSKHRGQNINYYALFVMFTHEFLTQPTVQYKHHVFGYVLSTNIYVLQESLLLVLGASLCLGAAADHHAV
jgi:hypothetical protein